MKPMYGTRKTQILSQTKLAGLLCIFLLLAGCANHDIVQVESANQDTRVRLIVFHHTTADFAESLDILTQASKRPVSSHYLIPEPGDKSYGEGKLKTYQLVGEQDRAWHAGQSYWAGQRSLNDNSIGIELVNRAYCRESEQPSEMDTTPPRLCFFPDFDDSQLALLAELLGDILSRHTEVRPTHIVGHSDIAPQRKVDPGPRFPWERLYRLGYGAWYDDETVFRYWQLFRLQMPDLKTLQTTLSMYGYEIEPTGENDETSQNVIRAFQMHFRPWGVNGEFDAETAATLYALLEKYYPGRLSLLAQ